MDDLEQSIADEGGEEQETEEDVSESSTSHLTSGPSTSQTSLEASSSYQHHQVSITNPERAHTSKQKLREKSFDEVEMEKVTVLKKLSETLVDAGKDVDQTFGKQVVTEIKMIKDPLTKMRLRRNILMMLYDAHEKEARLALHPDTQRVLAPNNLAGTHQF